MMKTQREAHAHATDAAQLDNFSKNAAFMFPPFYPRRRASR